MDNNRLFSAAFYNAIDSTIEKNEENINKLLQQLDVLSEAVGLVDLMDFDEEPDLAADEAEYADLLVVDNKIDSNDYRFN
ncbi:hypothetical protein [Spartinivicinus poritis]|uniref:Uncharacterized protein n=1 Tax=Spartinivicinus poritis TaxID=2994640 RepID=A0ABT5U812_9GAMM|nr:hypothetical protein [Spartinivicinus sp. A2-2]MDE1462136.1 hypothetical protein [Spartinivicinus sp. A2-2]